MNNRKNPFADLIDRYSTAKDTESDGVELDDLIEQAEAEDELTGVNVESETEADFEAEEECQQPGGMSTEEFLKSSREEQYKNLLNSFTPDEIKEVEEKFRQSSLNFHRDEAYQEDIVKTNRRLSITKKYAARTSLSAQNTEMNLQLQDPSHQELPREITEILNCPNRRSSITLRVREYDMEYDIPESEPAPIQDIPFEPASIVEIPCDSPSIESPHNSEMQQPNHQMLLAPTVLGSFDLSPNQLVPHTNTVDSCVSDSSPEKSLEASCSMQMNPMPDGEQFELSKVSEIPDGENQEHLTELIEISSNDEEADEECQQTGGMSAEEFSKWSREEYYKDLLHSFTPDEIKYIEASSSMLNEQNVLPQMNPMADGEQFEVPQEGEIPNGENREHLAEFFEMSSSDEEATHTQHLVHFEGPQIPIEITSDDNSFKLSDISTAGSSLSTDDDDLFFADPAHWPQIKRKNHRIKKWRKRREEHKQMKEEQKVKTKKKRVKRVASSSEEENKPVKRYNLRHRKQ